MNLTGLLDAGYENLTVTLQYTPLCLYNNRNQIHSDLMARGCWTNSAKKQSQLQSHLERQSFLWLGYGLFVALSIQ